MLRCGVTIVLARKFIVRSFTVPRAICTQTLLNSRYYGCSSHPLCKAFRKTRKNGAVVELAAEEKRYDSSHTSSPASDEPHNSDVVRYVLINLSGTMKYYDFPK